MQAVRQWLRDARSIAVLTGAGVSAESGVPTFRGENGLWKQYRAEDLATPAAFERDPKLVWEWYDWRRSLIARADPNPGHYALARAEARARKFTLITQNVDGLHERAGSRNVLRLHGSIWRLRCLECGLEREDRRTPLPGEMLPADVWREAEAAARSADLFLVIGTSALVYPAAGLASIAKSSGARVVELNIAKSGITGAIDEFVEGRSGELLPQLIA